MANLISNLFSNLSGLWGSKRFFDNKYSLRSMHHEMLGNKSVYRLDTNDYIQIAKDVPQLSLVVSKKAELLSNGIWKHYTRDGEEIENSEALERLLKPNYYQSGTEFLKELSVCMSLFGNAIVKKNKAILSGVPRSLFILPYHNLEIETSGKMYYDVNKVSDIILKICDKSIVPENVFNAKEIILFRDGMSTSALLSESRVDSIRVPLSNIQVAYDTRNVGMQEKGALGMFSVAQNSTSDGMPVQSFHPKDKKEVEKKLTSDYGIKKGQNRFMWLDIPVDYNEINYDLSKLKLFEEVYENFLTIVDEYGLVKDIFSTDKNSTFENKDKAEKQVYQNTIMPLAKYISEIITKEMKLENGEYLELCYDHLPSMQEDVGQMYATEKTKLEILTSALDKNIITRQEFRDNLPDFLELDNITLQDEQTGEQAENGDAEQEAGEFQEEEETEN